MIIIISNFSQRVYIILLHFGGAEQGRKPPADHFGCGQNVPWPTVLVRPIPQTDSNPL